LRGKNTLLQFSQEMFYSREDILELHQAIKGGCGIVEPSGEINAPL